MTGPTGLHSTVPAPVRRRHTTLDIHRLFPSTYSSNLREDLFDERVDLVELCVPAGPRAPRGPGRPRSPFVPRGRFVDGLWVALAALGRKQNAVVPRLIFEQRYMRRNIRPERSRYPAMSKPHTRSQSEQKNMCSPKRSCVRTVDLESHAGHGGAGRTSAGRVHLQFWGRPGRGDDRVCLISAPRFSEAPGVALGTRWATARRNVAQGARAVLGSVEAFPFCARGLRLDLLYKRHNRWLKRVGDHPLELIRSELAGKILPAIAAFWTPVTQTFTSTFGDNMSSSRFARVAASYLPNTLF